MHAHIQPIDEMALTALQHLTLNTSQTQLNDTAAEQQFDQLIQQLDAVQHIDIRKTNRERVILFFDLFQTCQLTEHQLDRCIRKQLIVSPVDTVNATEMNEHDRFSAVDQGILANDDTSFTDSDNDGEYDVDGVSVDVCFENT